MSESILQQSKKAKGLGGFGTKVKVFVLTIVICGGAYYAYVHIIANKGSAGRQMVQQKSATVTKGDIQLAVETDGTVVAEDGVELSFSTTGETVEKIYVAEGDTVKKGDKIASISTDSMQHDLQNAQDSYNAALLALSDAKAGASAKDIKNSQYQVEQAETSLAQAKTDVVTAKADAEEKVEDAEEAIRTAQDNIEKGASGSSEDLEDAYATLYSDIEAFSLTLKNNLYSADKILGIDDVSLNNDFEGVLGVLNTSSLYASQNSYSQTKSDRQKLEAMLSSTSKTDYDAMDKMAAQAKLAATDSKNLFANLQKVLDATITSTDLSQSELDSMKSNVSSLRSSATASVSTIDKDIDAIDSVEDDAGDNTTTLQTAYDKAVANLADVKRQNEIDIANAESAIRNKEIALDQAKMSYADLIAPLTTSELQKLVTQVNQARNNLGEMQDKIDEATLVSPIDGQVGNINGKEGSLISANSSESFATIINKDTLFVQVNVEESDINSIDKGQKAYVTFDAVEGLKMEGTVTYISMTAGASNSGVVTYEVRVVLDNVGQTSVKEGMTAFVSFVSDEVKDVLRLPVAAVTNVDGVASVKKADGKYQEVVTGFTDGSMVEIVSGLEEGEKIVY